MEKNDMQPDPNTTRPAKTHMLSTDVDLSNDFLKRKFGRMQTQPQDIICEFTRDPGLLHQYYFLREERFINLLELKNFTGEKDAFDDQSEIMVVRIGNHCVGGCRLTFSTPEDRKKLPMERDGFTLPEALQELPLATESYVEISRMAILTEFQNSVAMLEMSRQLFKHIEERNTRYAFTLAPVMLANNQHTAIQLFGMPWEVCNGIAVPQPEEYIGMEMVLSMLDLSKLHRRKAKPMHYSTLAVAD